MSKTFDTKNQKKLKNPYLQIKLHRLLIRQTLKSLFLDLGEMDKVVLAISADNKAEALLGVVEFNGSGVRHVD